MDNLGDGKVLPDNEAQWRRDTTRKVLVQIKRITQRWFIALAAEILLAAAVAVSLAGKVWTAAGALAVVWTAVFFYFRSLHSRRRNLLLVQESLRRQSPYHHSKIKKPEPGEKAKLSDDAR
jgi:hypothetical protein